MNFLLARVGNRRIEGKSKDLEPVKEKDTQISHRGFLRVEKPARMPQTNRPSSLDEANQKDAPARKRELRTLQLGASVCWDSVNQRGVRSRARRRTGAWSSSLPSSQIQIAQSEGKPRKCF
jgi:hypothetical protein